MEVVIVVRVEEQMPMKPPELVGNTGSGHSALPHRPPRAALVGCDSEVEAGAAIAALTSGCCGSHPGVRA